MIKILWVLALVFNINLALSAELMLITDKSKASNEVRVYIKNIGDKKAIVLTKNLTFRVADNEVVMSPERHVLINNGSQIPLKEDLSLYGAVTLRPDETTYIQRPIIEIPTGKLIYKVKPEWAELQGIWGGTIDVDF
ncbi:hypothetical protein [Paraglaciecola arctica]|uniref:Uncharacterized protein n=1 Tax=Paraglaciecola arctica BSs20135 TaxID=493475 RepID=K6XKJ7_9ALTE|nr:hypothetical protein [Paraglaciecola arctica]GAC21189.1 hypothetical protein GARC_4247 [Paraglaciecola arctica BSs20135]